MLNDRKNFGEFAIWNDRARAQHGARHANQPSLLWVAYKIDRAKGPSASSIRQRLLNSDRTTDLQGMQTRCTNRVQTSAEEMSQRRFVYADVQRAWLPIAVSVPRARLHESAALVRIVDKGSSVCDHVSDERSAAAAKCRRSSGVRLNSAMTCCANRSGAFAT